MINAGSVASIVKAFAQAIADVFEERGLGGGTGGTGGSIDTTDLATEASLSAVRDRLPSGGVYPTTQSGTWTTSLSDGGNTASISAGGALSVSAATLPLPTGASSETTLGQVKTLLTGLPKEATGVTFKTLVLTSQLVEVSISLSCTSFECYVPSEIARKIRWAVSPGATTGSQYYSVLESLQSYGKERINFNNQVVYFSTPDTIPSVSVSNCTLNGTSIVVASTGAFTNVVNGQMVAGTGIPTNTYGIVLDTNASQLKLVDVSGNAVNTTVSGSTTLTISGVVVRFELWS